MEEATITIPGKSTTTNFISIDEDRAFLLGEDVVRVYDSIYQVNPETGEKGSFLRRQNERLKKYKIYYPLKKVDKSFIKTIRNLDEEDESGIPYFILKDNENYYYCEVPLHSSFSDLEKTFQQHKCANCDRLRGLPYDKGGCDKVYDKDAKIEDYPFITFGFETINFGCFGSKFFVSKCKCFKPYPR